jgi:hypothetical protein
MCAGNGAATAQTVVAQNKEARMKGYSENSMGMASGGCGNPKRVATEKSAQKAKGSGSPGTSKSLAGGMAKPACHQKAM